MLGKFNTTENLPVLYEADVAVIGAGPGGLGAAIMSSKCGAKTVLIEAYGLPGGMAVIGEVQPFMISGTREKPLDGPIYTQWNFGKGKVGTFACDLNGTWSSDFISSPEGQKILKKIIYYLIRR